MIEKPSTSSRLFDAFNVVFLIVIGFICLYPFWYVLVASFSNPNQFIQHDFTLLLFPKGFSLEAYKQVFTKDIAIGYLNTIFYVVVGTLISMFLTFLGAYVLSRKGFLFKVPLTFMVIFTMYFSGGIIPTYIWIQQMNLIDTRWAILLPAALSTYNLIVLRTSFASVPESLIEAAKLDGANDFTCLWKIMIPLSKATISVIILFYAVSRWNEWLPATMFLRTRELFPLQIFLREILLTSSSDSIIASGGDSTNITALAEIIKYATIVVSTVPVLCIYPFVQKYFVSGMMIGGVKE
ncbi:MAG: carbohydrate ABC transporter permease [Oscillospiraceae bacterium]